MQLLHMPDLDRAWAMENASTRDIDLQISEIISKGKELTPDKHQDLRLGVQRFTSALLWGRSRGLPQDRQELLINWINHATDLLNQAKEAEFMQQQRMAQEMAPPKMESPPPMEQPIQAPPLMPMPPMIG